MTTALDARRLPAAVEVRRVRPSDAAITRALRLEMLADSPLAFLETLAQAAARPHAEYAARIAANSTGDRVAQFIAVADPAASAEAIRRLDARGLPLAAVELQRPSLDDVFLALTGRTAGDEPTDQSRAQEAA